MTLAKALERHNKQVELDYFKRKLADILLWQVIQKALKANVGEVHDWANGRYKKVANGEWIPVRENEEINQAAIELKRKIDLAESEEDLMKIVAGSKQYFTDGLGFFFPIVKELDKYIDRKHAKLEVNSGSGYINKDESKMNLFKFENTLKENAIPFPKMIFSKENYETHFKAGIKTPIEDVKLGENQYMKFERLNRTDLIGATYETLKNPVFIATTENGAKLYVKSFIKDSGRIRNIVSVVVDKKDLHISISTHEERTNQIYKKITELIYNINEFGSYDGTVRKSSVAG